MFGIIEILKIEILTYDFRFHGTHMGVKISKRYA